MRYYKNINFLSFFAIICFAFKSFASISDSANFICGQIIENPSFNYESHFSKSFMNKIKYENLVSVLQGVYSDDGNCTKAIVLSPDGASSKAALRTNTTEQRFIISLDANGLISGLQYVGRSTPKVKINSLEDLKSVLDGLGDISSLYIKNYSKNEVASEINANKRLALGSEFKLYVLNYLDQKIALKKYNWDDKLKVYESQKSLPSGILQTYPEGSEFTLKQFAELMISKSDNTATDHLINFLGKENIENTMFGLNSFLQDNSPLLTTMDMFRLRTLSSDQVDSYLKSDVNQKRTFLLNLQNNLSRDEVVTHLSNWDQPKDIQKVEWYASTSDVCSVVENIKHQADFDQNIYDIMSINTPFVWIENDPYFEYVGYKGGSEPGVMTMTFLVKTKKQDWACISMGINNQKQSLNETAVADLYHAILNYAGERLNH